MKNLIQTTIDTYGKAYVFKTAGVWKVSHTPMSSNNFENEVRVMRGFN